MSELLEFRIKELENVLDGRKKAIDSCANIIKRQDNSIKLLERALEMMAKDWTGISNKSLIKSYEKQAQKEIDDGND